MDGIAAPQQLFVGLVLIWTGYSKTFGRWAGVQAQGSALRRLVGERNALPAYRLVGGVELLIGGALLVPPWWWGDAAAASVLAVGFIGYLGYARLAAPDSSCGCLGSARVPVTTRSFARAGLVLVASVTAIAADVGWTTAMSNNPAASGAVVVAELVAFVALSPEFDRLWLVPARQWRVRRTHPLNSGSFVPLEASIQQVLQSQAYGAVAGAVGAAVKEYWDDGGYRFVCYPVMHDEGPATAVFAVPLSNGDPDAVRVAIVDDRSGATIFRPELSAPRRAG
jgi:hypothetical protein